MPNQPENPQHSRSRTGRNHPTTSVAFDSETPNTEIGGEEPIPDLPEDQPSSTPKSMPWPEIPKTRPKTANKTTLSPTKPSLDDDWFTGFQEPDHAFSSPDYKPEPAKTPPLKKTSSTPQRGQRSSPGAPPTILGDEWAATSTPPRFIEKGPSEPGKPLSSEVTQSPDMKRQEVSPVTPVPSPVPNSPPDSIESMPVGPFSGANSEATPPEPETSRPTRFSIPATSPGRYSPVESHAPQSAPGHQDTSIPPVVPAPVGKQPPSDSSSSALPLGGAVHQPDILPDPTPRPQMYSPVPVPPPSSALPPKSGMAPSPSSPTPVEASPLSTIQEMSTDSSEPPNPEPATILPPTNFSSDLPDEPTFMGSPPTTTWDNTLASREPFAPIPTSPEYSGPPARQVSSPIAQEPDGSKTSFHPSPESPPIVSSQDPGASRTHEDFPRHRAIIPPSDQKNLRAETWDPQTPTTTPQTINPLPLEKTPTGSTLPGLNPANRPAASNSMPPAPIVTSPTLDEEWMASRNDVQEEWESPRSSAPMKGSQPLNQYAPPKDWGQTDHQPSASLHSSGSVKPSVPPSSEETTEKGISLDETSNRHMVQAWPSASSSVPGFSPSKPAQNGPEANGTNAQESRKTAVQDTDVFKLNQAVDDGYGPFRLRRPTFTGDGSTLFGIFTTNTVWTILTLGLYSFWGRVNIRRYLFSHTKFAGARFAFHGTGGELLLGWINVLVFFGTPYLALNYFGKQHSEGIWWWSNYALAGLLIACLIPTAMVGAHRYRMSRTSWRGIRFSFRRSIPAFILLYLKGVLCTLFSLGFYYPIFDHARRAFLTSGTYFGDQPFEFDGEPKALGQLYFKAFKRLVLILVTAEIFLLGTSFLASHFRPNQVVDLVFLSSVGTGAIVIHFLLGLWFWLQAAKQRYMWNHTTFGTGRFRATMKGRHLFELKCTNFILLMFSLGLAWPWVKKRNLQFQYYHVGFRGPLRLEHIMQQAASGSPMGEELAGFVDAGFEM